MKVVILHQHFNTPVTGGGIRSWYLATALVQRGIEVIVITAHNEKSYLKNNVDGIEVHYLPVAYDNKFGFVARSNAFMKYAWQSARLFSQLKDVKICYAISVPLTVGLAAIWIKQRFQIPFIFEVGDLWPEAPVQMGFIKNYFFKESLYKLERKIYNAAESIVALSTAIQSEVAKKAKGKKIDLIPNMADCDFYKPAEKDPSLEEKYHVQKKIVISYIGAIGLANGLDYFIECANVSKRHNLPAHFILCGEGALRDRLIRHAEQLQLTNLTFVDAQNRNGVKEILNITDAAFVSYKRLPVLETGSPNKFFDGLAAGKLMIVNFGGWIRKEIEETQCGFYADPNQPTDFVSKVRAYVFDGHKLRKAQEAARKLAEQKYSRQILSDQFIKLFE